MAHRRVILLAFLASMSCSSSHGALLAPAPPVPDGPADSPAVDQLCAADQPPIRIEIHGDCSGPRASVEIVDVSPLTEVNGIRIELNVCPPGQSCLENLCAVDVHNTGTDLAQTLSRRRETFPTTVLAMVLIDDLIILGQGAFGDGRTPPVFLFFAAVGAATPVLDWHRLVSFTVEWGDERCRLETSPCETVQRDLRAGLQAEIASDPRWNSESPIPIAQGETHEFAFGHRFRVIRSVHAEDPHCLGSSGASWAAWTEGVVHCGGYSDVQLPWFDRSCDASSDCAAGLPRPISCCGPSLITGIARSELDRYNMAAEQCSEMFLSGPKGSGRSFRLSYFGKPEVILHRRSRIRASNGDYGTGASAGCSGGRSRSNW